MKKQWTTQKLGSIAPFIYGKSLTAQNRLAGEYDVYSSGGICGKSDKKLAENGIIVGRKGSAGSLFYSKKPFFCIDTAFYIDKVSSECDIKFLYYYMQLLRLESFNNDAAVPGLNRNLAHNLKVTIPDLPTQKRIADILSAYDDLIENNNRRIAILEKSAQELYKEWFVRFRFPNYEKTKFVNGLPEGWEVFRVGDIVKIKSGFAFKSEFWQDSGVPVVKIKNIQNNTVETNDFSYVSKEYAKKSKDFYVKAGDLLIAMTGATIGKIALVPHYELMTVNQRVGKFFLGESPHKNVAFLYCVFLQQHVQEQVLAMSSGSTAQPNISPFDIEKIKFFSNKECIDLFNKTLETTISGILKIQQQNSNLAKQRDLLLPRFLSGKLEV